MYLDVYHLLSHLTVEFTFRWLQVGEVESLYDTKAKFEVITPHGAMQHLQYTAKALDGRLGMSYK